MHLGVILLNYFSLHIDHLFNTTNKEKRQISCSLVTYCTRKDKKISLENTDPGGDKFENYIFCRFPKKMGIAYCFFYLSIINNWLNV